MIGAVPTNAKYPYQAFALRPADIDEAHAIALMQIAGDASRQTRMAAWLAPWRDRVPDLRFWCIDGEPAAMAHAPIALADLLEGLIVPSEVSRDLSY